MDCAGSKQSTRIAALFFFSVSLLPSLWAQARPNAQELLGQMTLEEKIAQLSQLPGMPIPEFKEQVGADSACEGWRAPPHPLQQPDCQVPVLNSMGGILHNVGAR